MHLLFALLVINQYSSIYTHIYIFHHLYTAEGLHIIFRLLQQHVVLECAQIQSYSKMQIYDLGEWCDLRWTISTRWWGR